jgi:hypothetical protein
MPRRLLAKHVLAHGVVRTVPRPSSDGRHVDRARSHTWPARLGGTLTPAAFPPPSHAPARGRCRHCTAPSSPCLGRHAPVGHAPDTAAERAVTGALHGLRARPPPWLRAHDTTPSTEGPSGDAHPPAPGAHRGGERRRQRAVQDGRRTRRLSAHRGRWRPPLAAWLSSARVPPRSRDHARVPPPVQRVRCAHAPPHRDRGALGHPPPRPALTPLRRVGPPGPPPGTHRARYTPAKRPPCAPASSPHSCDPPPSGGHAARPTPAMRALPPRMHRRAPPRSPREATPGRTR